MREVIDTTSGDMVVGSVTTPTGGLWDNTNQYYPLAAGGIVNNCNLLGWYRYPPTPPVDVLTHARVRLDEIERELARMPTLKQEAARLKRMIEAGESKP